MKRVFIFGLMLILHVAPLLAQGIKARVSGLESNGEYMTLLDQEHSLKIQEDSINLALTTIRGKFSADGVDRTALGRDILKLESEMFDVRNQMGIVRGKIGDIEQDFVINNLDVTFKPQSPTIAKPSGVSYANLVRNEYFAQNLPKADYQELLEAQSKENSVLNYIKIYSNNYKVISELAADYGEVQDAHKADSIQQRYDQLIRLNRIISDSVGIMWERIFDNKSYVYSYVFDRLNRSAELSSFENRVKGASGALSQPMMSEQMHRYAILKPMLLDYEAKLATTLGITKAADSLSNAAKIMNIAEFDFPLIEFKERTFITYEPLGAPLASLYNSSHPIPKLTIMPRGTVYRVLVGSYSRTQPVSLFKGLNPLYVHHSGAQMQYFAGGFRTLEEAQEAHEKVVKAGFRKSVVTMWEDGQYSTIAPQEHGASAKSEGSTLYRLELLGCGETLSDRIKETISTEAPNKELSRVASAEGVIYIIGSFDTAQAAQKLADIIGGLQNGVTTKIIKTDPQPTI